MEANDLQFSTDKRKPRSGSKQSYSWMIYLYKKNNKEHNVLDHFWEEGSQQMVSVLKSLLFFILSWPPTLPLSSNQLLNPHTPASPPSQTQTWSLFAGFGDSVCTSALDWRPSGFQIIHSVVSTIHWFNGIWTLAFGCYAKVCWMTIHATVLEWRTPPLGFSSWFLS